MKIRFYGVVVQYLGNIVLTLSRLLKVQKKKTCIALTRMF
jgi:hypothetical protein